MDVIDEKGRLFGRVNVIDALVVVVLVALLVGGVFLLIPSKDPPETTPESKYATISVEESPPWLVSEIRPGDDLSVQGGSGTLEVTDVYVTAGSSGSVRTVIQAEYPVDSPPSWRGEILRPGLRRTLLNEKYWIGTSFVGINGTRSQLPTEEVQVVVERPVTSGTARSIETGDEYRVGNRTIATVESVTVMPRLDDEQELVRLGLRIRTIRIGNERQYGGRTLRIDSPVAFRTGEYHLVGHVVALDSLEPPGESVPVTMTVVWENVRPGVADAVEVGMAEQHRGANARVVHVNTEPTRVDDGLQRTPPNQDVTLTIRARARRVDGGLQFHGRPLRTNGAVVLDFGTVTVQGVVTNASER